MSYYDTIDKDLARAKAILLAGKLTVGELSGLNDITDPVMREKMIAQSGTIYGQDIYAAYKLLESLVEHAGRLRAACQALLDAPHQEHFVVRLNDDEMEALNTIKQLVKL